MREITLSKGYTTQVDDKEYARCMVGPKWHAQEDKRKDGTLKNIYAIRHVRLENGKYTTQSMHRFILGVTDPDVQVDHHPDFSGLNNQRHNLRKATKAQNMHNQRLSSVNTSGFKGVSWHKARQKWQAKIQIEGKSKHLGLFTDVQDAACAYDDAAIELHGQFAYTNAMIERTQ